ncbi:MAG: carbohydrate binding family 9 domain-containing protein [Acidobacteria bacterium]|nr:carbohydrate binding family 9 domain-containing protein [Acidobacteriota bacterium]
METIGTAAVAKRITWPAFLGVVLLWCGGRTLLFGQGAPAGAQVPEQRKTVAAMRISSAIRMDGVLDEAVWQEAEPASQFVQAEPYEGEAATELTEVKLLYDNENLYIGVYCRDSAPDGILVNSLKEDFSPEDADSFEVILDTLGDQRNGFLFITNPRGAKRDSQVSDEGRTVNANWDAVWDVRARTSRDGWSAEMVIPFRSLSLEKNRAEQLWGINFSRRIRRKNEIDFWSFVPRRYSITRLSLAGQLDGLEGIERGRNLKLKPFVVAEANKFARNDHVIRKGKEGVDLKYNVTPSLTLDLTANTDFSQVEVDEQQINLTRFPLFFPEKREFFLENEGIFQFGDIPGERGPERSRETQLFFSRRVGLSKDGDPIPIWGGMRLSGQVGDYSLGLLNMQTKKFGGQPGNNFSAVRLKRNVLANSDVGAIFVNRQAAEGKDYNRAWGVDGNFKFWQKFALNGYLAQTLTDHLKDENWTKKLSGDWLDRLLRLSFVLADEDQNFNPEMGFTQRTGVRYLRGRSEFFVRPRRNSIVRQVRPHFYYTIQWDQQNHPLSKEKHYALVDVAFQNGAGFEVFYNSFFERLRQPFQIRPDIAIPVGDYDYTEWVFQANSDASKMISGDLTFRIGEFYSGDTTQLVLNGTFRPNYRLSIENRYSFNDVTLREGAFSTRLFRTKVDYYFSTRMFLNAFIQYNSDRKQVTSNIRLNFIHRPLSDLFLVYNEAREVSGARRNDRAITLKYTHMMAF